MCRLVPGWRVPGTRCVPPAAGPRRPAWLGGVGAAVVLQHLRLRPPGLRGRCRGWRRSLRWRALRLHASPVFVVIAAPIRVAATRASRADTRVVTVSPTCEVRCSINVQHRLEQRRRRPSGQLATGRPDCADSGRRRRAAALDADDVWVVDVPAGWRHRDRLRRQTTESRTFTRRDQRTPMTSRPRLSRLPTTRRNPTTRATP